MKFDLSWIQGSRKRLAKCGGQCSLVKYVSVNRRALAALPLTVSFVVQHNN